MKRLNNQPLFVKLLLVLLLALIQSCSSDVGGNGDVTKPVITLTSLNEGEEVVGDFNITWTTNEVNKSKVDIHLSYDSGATYNDSDTIVINTPDTGSYTWKTNDIPALKDCRSCRVRVIPSDIIGNVGDPAESEINFTINNIPQVFGSALFYDTAFAFTEASGNGPSNGDVIVVPFDKEVTALSLDSGGFILPIIGDVIGGNGQITLGPAPNEITLTLSVNIGHLSIARNFSSLRKGQTSPSGIDVIANLPTGLLTAVDTGRTAGPSDGGGIDIAPTFSITPFDVGNNSSHAIAMGDVNGDGLLDIVTGNSNQGNTVLIQTPTPNATTSFSFIENQSMGGSLTESIKLVDVNGDNHLDVISGNFFNQPNLVWINDGSGFFNNPTQNLGASSTRSIAVGDINGDGSPDFISGNLGDTNQAWINNGAGVFNQGQTFPDNSMTRAVALADMDNDGDLDFYEGNFGQPNHLWLNDGTGTFTDRGPDIFGDKTTSVALEDIDNDGDIDILLATQENGIVALFNNLNVNDIFFGGTSLFVDASVIKLADIDDDGDIDIASMDSDTITLWQNQGTGVFTKLHQTALNDDIQSYRSMAFGDFDNDGDPDIVAGQSAPFPEKLLANSLRFPRQDFFVVGNTIEDISSAIDIDVGDIDNDNDLDVVLSLLGGRSTLLNDGKGVLTVSTQILDNTSPISELADVDGDGNLDLIQGVSGAGNRVSLNDGFGLFTDTEQTLGSNDTVSIKLADLDGDKDLDIVTGNRKQGTRIWLNNGFGQFTDSNQILALELNDTTSITLGDIDGDNDIDIIAGNLELANQVWKNDGTGTFIIAPSLSFGANATTSIKLVDIDNDGDLDLIEAIFQDAAGSRVWRNNGSGVFSDTTQSLLPNATTVSVAVGDVDDDGDIDLVFGNDTINSSIAAANNTLFYNNGSGEYTVSDTAFSSVAARTNAVIFADIDGDGDLDLLEAAQTGGSKIWLNDF